MAITFFGVFKVCFFCEFKPVSAWAWFKKFGAKEHAKSVVLAFALKKNIDTKTHHVYIICPRETMDFPKI